MAVKKRKFKEAFKLGTLIRLIKVFFTIQKYLLTIKTINYPEQQVLFAIWHRHQCIVYNTKDKSKFYVLVSASNDGEIVAKGIECLGLKSIRGSSKRHGTAASLEILDKLKEGNSVAIMVDGPRGPSEKVKDGIIFMAKNSGVPIVPVGWASKDKTFVTFNSWDKFQLPIGFCKTVAVYGDPIYVPSDITKEETKEWCEKIEEAIKKVESDAIENYDKYIKQ